jgi:hypothetical protein
MPANLNLGNVQRGEAGLGHARKVWQRKVSATRRLGIDESYNDNLGGLMTGLTAAIADWGKSHHRRPPRGTSDTRQARKGWRQSVVLDLSHSSHGAGRGDRLEVRALLVSGQEGCQRGVRW